MAKVYLAIIVLSASGWGQLTVFTTATAIVRDPNNVIYANGTYNISFVSATTGQNFVGLYAVVPASQSGSLDSFGAMSVQLIDNNQISPPGSQWRFSICSASGATCFATNITITGTSQDISAALKAAAAVLPSTGGGTTITSMPKVTHEFLDSVTSGGVFTQSQPTPADINGLVTSGLLAEYKMTEGAGTTLVDYSGNGNNGTFGTSTHAPSWITGTGGITVNNNQYVALPAALNAAATVQIFAYTNSATSYPTYPMLLGQTTNAQGIELALWASFGGSTTLGGEFYSLNPSIYSGATNNFRSAGGSTVNGYKLISWVLDASADSVYINGDETPFYIARNGSAGLAANNYDLGASTRPNCAVCYFNGPIYYAVFYNRKLSAAEISQNYTYISQALAARGLDIVPGNGTFTDSTDNVAFVGDSITWGNAATPYTSSLTLNGSWNVVNLGVSGWEVRHLIAEGSTRADAFFKPYAGKNLLVVFAGTNDFALGGATAAVTNARLAEYCRNRRLAGWRVLVATMLSRVGQDTNKRAYNALIRQQWPTYADGLVDLAANANLGADNAYSNATYFSDQIHPTNAGQLLIADIMSRVINAQYGNLLNSATLNTATGTYTEVDADIFVRADPSGGNVTITLPSAIGTTGQIRYIKNIQSVGANTVTVAAAGSEVIDGAASIKVSNLGLVALKSTLDSLTSGGAHWEKVAKGTVAELDAAQTFTAAQTINSLSVNGSQALTSVQGSTGTKVVAATGAFVSGNCTKTDANGNLVDAAATCGGGVTVIASGTSTMLTSTLTTGTCETVVTTSATGTATTDAIEWAFATAPVTGQDGRLNLLPYVTTNNVNWLLCNPTANSVTPTGLVVNWRVIR